MATKLSQGTNKVFTETWYDTAAGVMGNVLEWYDFALFGYFSGKSIWLLFVRVSLGSFCCFLTKLCSFFNEDIIGDIFFPPAAPGDNENLIKTFAIFGGAFVMRPVGGLLIVSSVVRKKWAIWYC